MKFLMLFFLCFSDSLPIDGGFGVGEHRIKRNDVSYGSPAYKNCECGKKNFLVGDIRIVGGIETAETEHPWMALITGNDTKLSGGTLINDRYVVTAAHILDRGFKMNDMKVVLGEYNVCESDDRIVTFSIEKLIIHPKYNGTTLFADIMLIRLNMRVTFNEVIRPICLPSTDIKMRTMRKYSSRKATVLGWGYTGIAKDVCILRMVDLQVFKSENCDSNIPTMICAGVTDGSERDACSGDSGGPLQVSNSRGKVELIGIVSSGIGCDTGTPGLYTDVPQMVAWIMKITTIDSMYCWR